MTGTIRYQGWYKDDLAVLARARSLHVVSTGKVPANGPTRNDYLHALKAADRLWEGSTFRFFDLPAELRNRVYEELLTVKPGEQRCWPKILWTSRQLHDEATSILYAEAVVPITLKTSGVVAGTHAWGTYAFGLVRGDGNKNMLNLVWPRFLRQCRRLQFVIDLHDYVPFGRHWRDGPLIVSQVLYSLCAHLQGGESLRSFTVVLDQRSRGYGIMQSSMVFDSLQLLGSLESLKIEYNSTVLTELSDEAWSGYTVLTGAVEHQRPLIREAIAYAELEEATYDLNDYGRIWKQCSRTGLGYKNADEADGARFADLLMHAGDNCLDRVQTGILPMVYCDWLWETRVVRCTRVLRGLLDELDMEGIEEWARSANRSGREKMKEFKRLRALRKA